MSKRNRYEKAQRRTEKVQGFVCPTCDSLVPRGYEICYNCGEDASLGLGSGSSGSSGDSIPSSYVATSCLTYISVLIVPVLYLMSIITLEPFKTMFQFLIVVPNAIIFLISLIAILTWRTALGWFFGAMHIWIILFSFPTLINSIKYYIF